MDSPEYSDSEESTCSSGSSGIDSAPKSVSLHPKSTDLGRRVLFTSGQDKKQKYGVLRYLGEPEFSEGVWCGVVLDQPQGKNNGSVHGIRYFTCEPNYGVFVSLDKVEVDPSNRRSRSRPNSQPGSRASSVERKGQMSRPSSASKPVHSQAYSTSSSSTVSSISLGPASKIGMSMQQDLVSRLSQPIKRQAQSHAQAIPNNGMSSSRRLPMKAFATKGTEEMSVKENKKPLMPFRAGGMYKASSSENLRSMQGKERVGSNASSKSTQGMPSKKSSSERDLRTAGKSSSVPSKPATSSSLPLRPKRKQGRLNSCSDILSSSVAPPKSKSDHDMDPPSRKVSCGSWPRTSTPGNRDELTPDGCSSPEETDDAFSRKVELLSHETHNNGFMEGPVDVPSSVVTKNGSGVMQEGLATHVKQFAESELLSPSLPHPSMQSPQRHSKHCYSNRLSGSATLSHPLTSSLVTDGAHLLKQLLGTHKTLDGVSAEDLIVLFDQQIQQWHSIVADLEGKLDKERAKSKHLEEQLMLAGDRTATTSKSKETEPDVLSASLVHSPLWDRPGLSNGAASHPIPSM